MFYILLKVLTDKGVEVLLAPLKDSDLESEAIKRGFKTFGIPYGDKGKEFNAVKVLLGFIKGKKINIVHSNSNLDRTIAAVAGKMVGSKNISSVHSCLSISRNLLHWYRNKYLINHFTPVGYSTKKIMVETDKIFSGKITVVHIGIPKDKIKKNEEGRLKVRNEFNIKTDEIVIGTLSRLVEFKGHRFLLQAIKELDESTKIKVKLLIVGEGELKDDLLHQAKESGIGQRVIFAGNRTDISDILSAFDVFSQFSIDAGGETFPVSIIEALAAGLPVIGSKVGDIEHLISNEKNGFLVPPEDIIEFNEAVKKLVFDTDKRNKHGLFSRGKFEKEFTLEIMIDNMLNVYNKVLKRNE